MPDEKLITQIESLMTQIVNLGGENERSSIVPNLTVIDANPTNLSGFVIVSDDRDGDNILAKKVGSVVYADNDLVNVMFLKGAEAIAFQQGSQSTNSGIWEIVPSTTTDIYYNKGNVGIGNAAPTTPLDVTGTVTITDDIVHAGDIDTKIGFTADKQSYTVGGLVALQMTNTGQDLIEIGDVAGGGDWDVNINSGQVFIEGSTGFLGINKSSSLLSPFHVDADNTIVERLTRLSTTDTNQFRAMAIYTLETTQASADGLGPNFTFNIIDSGGAGTLAQIGAKRSGAINKGAISLACGTGGVEQMVLIDELGLMGVGRNVTPSAALHVDQIGSGRVIPVVIMDQADIDEPFEKYIGTSTAANLSRSLVDNADVTTATLVGWRMIEIDDTANLITDGDYFVPFYTLA